MISMVFNVLDRFDLTKQCVDQALANAGTEGFEVLVCDQGSEDRHMLPYLRSLPRIAHVRENSENQGNYQMLNQLLLRTSPKAEYYCVIDPDISLPEGWLAKLVEVNKQVVLSGVSGLHCVAHPGYEETHNGIVVMRRPGGIFGTKFWNRRVMEEVGYFCEDYGFYGFGDSDLGVRCTAGGFINYYLRDMPSIHLGGDMDADTEYRRMKTKTLHAHKSIAGANFSRYKRTKEVYIGPPERT